MERRVWDFVLILSFEFLLKLFSGCDWPCHAWSICAKTELFQDFGDEIPIRMLGIVPRVLRAFVPTVVLGGLNAAIY